MEQNQFEQIKQMLETKIEDAELAIEILKNNTTIITPIQVQELYKLSKEKRTIREILNHWFMFSSKYSYGKLGPYSESMRINHSYNNRFASYISIYKIQEVIDSHK